MRSSEFRKGKWPAQGHRAGGQTRLCFSYSTLFPPIKSFSTLTAEVDLISSDSPIVISQNSILFLVANSNTSTEIVVTGKDTLTKTQPWKTLSNSDLGQKRKSD